VANLLDPLLSVFPGGNCGYQGVIVEHENSLQITCGTVRTKRGSRAQEAVFYAEALPLASEGSSKYLYTVEVHLVSRPKSGLSFPRAWQPRVRNPGFFLKRLPLIPVR
jgi:hypothetical protein